MSDVREEKREMEALVRQSMPHSWPKIEKGERNRLVKTLNEVVMTSVHQSTTSIYSGPIPSHEMLDGYNSVMPNGADRVMRMAEDQSQHRMRLEATTIASQNKQSERGQIFALASVLALICAGVWAIHEHETAVACTIFGTTVLGMGGVFAYGKFAMRKSLRDKAENAPPPRQAGKND